VSIQDSGFGIQGKQTKNVKEGFDDEGIGLGEFSPESRILNPES
jgi:hypothetical protein